MYIGGVILNIEELRDKADKSYELFKERQRRLYKLARDLGFTSQEARILTGSSEKNIKKLAAEKTPPITPY